MLTSHPDPLVVCSALPAVGHPSNTPTHFWILVLQASADPVSSGPATCSNSNHQPFRTSANSPILSAISAVMCCCSLCGSESPHQRVPLCVCVFCAQRLRNASPACVLLCVCVVLLCAVAHIKDHVSGQWWRFDDSDAELLGPHPTGWPTDHGSTAAAAGGKKAKEETGEAPPSPLTIRGVVWGECGRQGGAAGDQLLGLKSICVNKCSNWDCKATNMIPGGSLLRIWKGEADVLCILFLHCCIAVSRSTWQRKDSNRNNARLLAERAHTSGREYKHTKHVRQRDYATRTTRRSLCRQVAAL